MKKSYISYVVLILFSVNCYSAEDGRSDAAITLMNLIEKEDSDGLRSFLQSTESITILSGTQIPLPFYYAAGTNQPKIIDILGEHQDKVGNIDEVDKTGKSALYIAVIGNYFEVVQSLVKAGADPLLKDAFGKTIVDKAREKEREEIVSFLESQT